ncbi:MAG: hypothetical protein CMJ18_06410 [Phycisphaeraceae bacterium]|nr:hypothetical protein [Phycisphaeraceae bacterium]
MKNRLTWIIAVIVIAALAAYMFMFQVRYDEKAVLANFGKATDGSIRQPRKWPYLRWPWPVHQVHRYPTKIQLLERQLTQVQTADNYSVIVATHLAWRIDDPLKFFRNVNTLADADSFLGSRVADVQGIISRYRFGELFNTDTDRIKLGEIEDRSQKQLQEQLIADDFGITIERFGISRILLPESVTETVFEQMKERRQRLAENTRSSGVAEARKIRSQAASIKDQILAYANNYAEQIKARGNEESQKYYSIFARNESFAIYLRKLEALEKILKNYTTVFFPADQVLAPDKSIESSINAKAGN